MLVPNLNRKADVTVRNGVLLHKQLIRPPMDFSCSACRSAARSLRRLELLKSKSLCLATEAHWYVRNRHIHEDLCVPLLANHIRVMTETFD